ncbi:hypothetical protein AB0K14_26465 [Actinosynnema sp. NPDC050801]|uniref:hypothetical protein n=1 Tax=unclassified Actinosynnema TaxID=2637065 RepID=UPI0033ED80F6
MIRSLKISAIASALIGSFLVLGGGTANADPYWQPVTQTSAFHCTSVPHPTHNVVVKSCVVVNNTATQAVAIVANYGTSAVSLAAPHVALYVNGPITYDRDCLSSTLSGGYTRACFAPTQTRPCSAVVDAWSNVLVQGTVSKSGHPPARCAPDQTACRSNASEIDFAATEAITEATRTLANFDLWRYTSDSLRSLRRARPTSSKTWSYLTWVKAHIITTRLASS